MSENMSEKMSIPQNKLLPGFLQHQQEYEQKALEVLRSGWYVLGKEVTGFEREFAAYIGSKCCVGLASGLDALWLAFRVLGIGAGDEVIVQANTYIASVMGITMNGATPVFVEPDEYYEIDPAKLEEKITDKTKAVLVVHLYGMATQMAPIVTLCKKYKLRLVEDCAQSHGATSDGKMTGTFGDVGCFSFYPSKNLGAFGDGGAIVTDDEKLAEDFKMYRNYGSRVRYYNEVVGANSRLDEIQAGLLRVRLTHMAEITAEKTAIAQYYATHINNPLVRLPQVAPGSSCVWHQYVIGCEKRDALQNYLKEKGVGTIIHYPIPPHLAQAYEYLGFQKGDYPITEHCAATVLSLPSYIGMTEQELGYVADAINTFTGE